MKNIMIIKNNSMKRIYISLLAAFAWIGVHGQDTTTDRPLTITKQGSFTVGGTVLQRPGTYDNHKFISWGNPCRTGTNIPCRPCCRRFSDSGRSLSTSAGVRTWLRTIRTLLADDTRWSGKLSDIDAAGRDSVLT